MNCGILEMFTKKRIMCNVYSRINCISSIDTVEKFPDRDHSPKNFVGNPTNAGKIRRYSGKVLFVGVFQYSSIFQDGGMVMDEKGRNG